MSPPCGGTTPNRRPTGQGILPDPTLLGRRSGPDRFEIEVSADIALRYVTLELPGWTLSDNAFHLLAGVPYTVSARGSGAAPVGWVSSVDTLAPVSVTVPQ